MKAVAVFPGRRETGIVEHPEPEISRPGEVKLRILEVGICGTDREIREFEYGTPPAGSDYLILGHECLAEVVAVGSGRLERLSVGDLVVPMVRRPCPHAHCASCCAGRQDFCYTGDFTERGIKGAHGFLTERVVDEESYLHRVPGSIRDVAVLVEPLTIAEKAMQQVWDVQERLPWASRTDPSRGPGHGHRGLVLGGGPVGLLGAMVLVSRGFETFVYSREPETGPKAAVVAGFGARYISAGTHSVSELHDVAGAIDLVYEATGASRLAFEVLDLLDANAVFVFTGVPGRKTPVQVDTDRIMRNMVLMNQVVFGTVNAGPPAFQAAIRDLEIFLERWPRSLESIITGRYPMESYEALLSGEAGGIKNVIRIGNAVGRDG